MVSRYELPDADGLQLCNRVREQRPNCPFILFTEAGSEQVASDTISAGVTEYVRADATDDPYSVLADRVAEAIDTVRE